VTTHRKEKPLPTKVIVRYKPVSPLHGGREINPKDMESIGIFTQKTRLVWLRETGFWLDAEAAKVSKETLEWLRANTAEFTVEEQEVDGEQDTQTLAFQEAYQRSLTDSVTPDAPVEGERASESQGTARSGGTTTQSTAG
jgi:hypothetical protein